MLGATDPLGFTCSGSVVEEEEEGDNEEGSHSPEDLIKAEQTKLEEDKKALMDNHSMMAEVRVHDLHKPHHVSLENTILHSSVLTLLISPNWMTVRLLSELITSLLKKQTITKCAWAGV